MSSNVRGVRKGVCITLMCGTALGLIGCTNDATSRAQAKVLAASSPCTPAPFVNTNGTVPPGYNKPLFQLSHAYPASVPPLQDEPWRDAITGGKKNSSVTINQQNAREYVEALKTYVTAAMRKMLMDPDHWNAAAEGWYNEPWTGCLREPIHGMYVGSDELPADQFPKTGLTKPFTTYVLTFYDRWAAKTLYDVWGVNGENAAIGPVNGQLRLPQFTPGSVIVKAAFGTANGDVWPPMAHALQWPAFISTNATKGRGSKAPPQIDQLSFFQLDIIVKDPASSPRTGWVYTTLVYDNRLTGDAWDRMVPLGAMWGNDPEITNAGPPPGQGGPSQPPLRETWINPQAPAYAKTTLGWGGRLSGPNDGAVNDAVLVNGNRVHNLHSSSCMGCHISAEWQMKSDLLPTPTLKPYFPNKDGYMQMWVPASQQWMRWFQSSPGSQPMDSGATPLDYDMVFAFKSLPIWYNSHHPNAPLILTDRRGQVLDDYRGKPISN